jgi:hypothetical protein
MALLCGCGTGTWPTTRSLAVSMMIAWFVPKPDTSTWRPSGEIASPCGVGPTSIRPITRSVAVSMTLTVEAPSLLT